MRNLDYVENRWGIYAKNYKEHTFVHMGYFPWMPIIEGEHDNHWVISITRPFFGPKDFHHKLACMPFNKDIEVHY